MTLIAKFVTPFRFGTQTNGDY